MECKLWDLNYGDRFRFSSYGYVYLVIDVRNVVDNSHYDYLYIVDKTGYVDKIKNADAKDITVYKEV